MADILLFRVSGNKQPPYWNSTSGFDFDLFTVISMWFSIDIQNFIGIESITAELWRHNDFQNGGRQPCWIWFRVMADHLRSVTGGLCFILKFRLDRVLAECDYMTFRSLLSQPVCLSSLCNVGAPYSGVELVGNIFSPVCTLANLWPPCEILWRSSQGNPSVGGVKRKSASKIERWWTYRRLYLINGTRYGLEYNQWLTWNDKWGICWCLSMTLTHPEPGF